MWGNRSTKISQSGVEISRGRSVKVEMGGGSVGRGDGGKISPRKDGRRINQWSANSMAERPCARGRLVVCGRLGRGWLELC